ncbi:hypothetical protein AFLA_008290 [Aspergillus flavus NRRL3357]|nr:hypothetical protein AFLA_008290 [Aspergillus flavus NRRL3357]
MSRPLERDKPFRVSFFHHQSGVAATPYDRKLKGSLNISRIRRIPVQFSFLSHLAAVDSCSHPAIKQTGEPWTSIRVILERQPFWRRRSVQIPQVKISSTKEKATNPLPTTEILSSRANCQFWGTSGEALTVQFSGT